ncbi:MAG: GNAT family N-acetyltransferase [Oscillospiraceae bacterium]|nr:GNAT family N-acetyltransferase [Oscillospiraceae bacterium]
MDLTIRDVTEADFSTVETFIKMLHYTHAVVRPDVFLPEGFVYDREKDFLPCLPVNGGIALLAQADGQPAGLCLCHVRDRDDSSLGQYKECHVSDLVVHPDFRRRGVAKALMAETEKRAKALGAERLSLTVWRFNESAQALYESLGYEGLWSWMEKKI